jgi:XisH protein
MPARDKYHDPCKEALIKDGWVITDDPLHLKYGGQDMFVDLGAEEVIGAEKAGRRVAIEIKSFLGQSDITELENAVGQFIVYRDVLQETGSDRELYLAVTEETFLKVFEAAVGKLLIARQKLRVIVFDPKAEVITKWLP